MISTFNELYNFVAEKCWKAGSRLLDAHGMLKLGCDYVGY
jgi:hypothetical protein